MVLSKMKSQRELIYSNYPVKYDSVKYKILKSVQREVSDTYHRGLLIPSVQQGTWSLLKTSCNILRKKCNSLQHNMKHFDEENGRNM